MGNDFGWTLPTGWVKSFNGTRSALRTLVDSPHYRVGGENYLGGGVYLCQPGQNKTSGAFCRGSVQLPTLTRSGGEPGGSLFALAGTVKWGFIGLGCVGQGKHLDPERADDSFYGGPGN